MSLDSQELIVSEDTQLDVEYLVLGQAINFQEQASVLIQELKEEHFQQQRHKVLFNAVDNLIKRNNACNAYFIWEEIKNSTKVNQIDASYILSICYDNTTYVDLFCYINFLKERLANQKLLKIFEDSSKIFQQPFNKKPLKIFIKEIQSGLDSIQNQLNESKVDNRRSIGDILFSTIGERSLIESIHNRYEFRVKYKKDFLESLPTGFQFLDDNVSLLSPGNYVVLAARPSVGKTAFAINLALNLAFQKKVSVGFFSLEMSKNQIAERILSKLCSVSMEMLKRGNFDKKVLDKLVSTSSSLKETPLYVISENCFSLNDISNHIRSLKNNLGVSIVFIDYVQLIKSESLLENRQNEVAEISRKLKSLALELNIPIVCLSQLSRRIEERGNKRPVLSDIRDSGQIEQDADAVLFLHKKEYAEPQDASKHFVELILSKNRHGPTLSNNLIFDVVTGSFYESNEKW